MADHDLTGFDRESFSAGSVTHDLLRKGEGPAVIVTHTDCGGAFHARLVCDACTQPLRGADIAAIRQPVLSQG